MKKIVLFLSLLLSLQLTAQTKMITGTVMDENNEPLIGASVVEEGTTNGVITDLDGVYRLTVNENAKLMVSYIGYISQTVRVGNQTTLNFVMKEDGQMLEEVVVTGYSGKQLRSKVTSSIAKVKEETFQVGLFSNPAQALSGAVAGLRVTQSSGNPGATPAIVLRGGTNLDGTGSPLVVVDGQIRGGMQDINPEDIESMDVLKDAGATAIYGARASNGVILITTKTGKSGKANINFKAKVGLNYLNNPYDFVGAEDFIYWQRTAIHNSYHLATNNEGGRVGYGPYGNLTGATPYGTGNVYGRSAWSPMYLNTENEWLLERGWLSMADPLDPTKTIIFTDVDPVKTNFNTPAITQDYNVNMSGGNDKGSYYAGLGYNHSEGLPIKSFYKRYNFTINADYNITNWLKTESRLNFTKAEWQSMPGSQGSEANYFGRILSIPPTVRYWDVDGNPLLGPNAGDGNQNFQPDKWQIDNESQKFSMTQAFQIDFMKGLYLRTTMNWFYNEEVKESFTKDFQTNPLGAMNTTRSTSAGFYRTFDQTYNAVLNFTRRIAEDHNVNVMVGTEYYDSYYRSIYAAGSGAPTDDFGDLGLTSKGENKRTIDSSHEKMKILSYFGNISYDYKDRYLINAVFRSDGFSVLHKDNRWGFFPGVSGGWIFSREEFMREVNRKINLSYAKLRVSYGVNGNVPIGGNAGQIGKYQAQGTYNTINYDGETGFLIGNLPLPNLRWERTRTFEGGLEAHFLNNRFRSSFTFYNRLTSDKFANVSLPTSTGFSQILTNNGEIQNRGLEIELSADILKTKDWSWDASINFAYNKNKIVSLPYNGLERNRQDGQQVYTGRKLPDGTYEKKWVGGYQEGMEPNQLVIYAADGIYRSYDEIPANLIVQSAGMNGQMLYGPEAWKELSLSKQNSGSHFPLQPGDIKWRDINGDGLIDSYDQINVGNRVPHWTGGFNTQLTWKGLSLYARFDFAWDYWIFESPYSGSNMTWYLGNMQGTYSIPKQVFDTWTPENPTAKYPRYLYADQLGMSNYYTPSTLFAYKGNYLAIRELSLNYQLPKSLVDKLKMQAVNVSVTGQNLGYITSAKNVATPESTNAGAGYALPRTVVFGLNVTF